MRNKLTTFMNTPWTWGTYTKFSLISVLISLVITGWMWHKYFDWEPWTVKALKEWKERKEAHKVAFRDVREEVKD